MYVYILMVLLIIIFGHLFEKKNKKLYSLLIFILFTLVAGLRYYSVGTDTYTYLHFFDLVIEYQKSIFSISRYERGFITLVFLLLKIKNNYTFVLFIISGIINYFICNFIRKNSKNMCLSFLLFFLLRYFFSEMNIIREFISIGIFLYSTRYIENRKIIPYLICIFVAFLFHKSALVLVPFYFFNNINFTNKKKIVAFVCTLIFTIFLLYPILIFFTSKLGIYAGYVEFFGSNKAGSILEFLVYLSSYLFVGLINYLDESQENNLFDNLFYISVLCYLVSIKMSVFSRIANYFSIFSIVCIPNTLSRIKNRKAVYFLKVVLLVCFAIYCIVISYYRPSWNSEYPYLFFWEG